MKNIKLMLMVFCLVIGAWALVITLTGCGQTNPPAATASPTATSSPTATATATSTATASPSPTATLTVASSEYSALAQTVSLAGQAVTGMTSSSKALANISTGVNTLNIDGIKSFTTNPVFDDFFKLMTSLEGENEFEPPVPVQGAVQKLKFITRSGQEVTRAFLASCEVANLTLVTGEFSWDDLISYDSLPMGMWQYIGTYLFFPPGHAVPGWITFEASSVRLWDYICWSEIAPKIHTEMANNNPFHTSPYFSRYANGSDVIDRSQGIGTAEGPFDMTLTAFRVHLDQTISMSQDINGITIPDKCHGVGVATVELPSIGTTEMSVTIECQIDPAGSLESGTIEVAAIITLPGASVESALTTSLTIDATGVQIGTISLNGIIIGSILINPDGTGYWIDLATGTKVDIVRPTS